MTDNSNNIDKTQAQKCAQCFTSCMSNDVLKEISALNSNRGELGGVSDAPTTPNPTDTSTDSAIKTLPLTESVGSSSSNSNSIETTTFVTPSPSTATKSPLDPPHVQSVMEKNSCVQPDHQTSEHVHGYGDGSLIDDWEGYATTTQFGCGDGAWGETPYGMDIKKMNSELVPSMGAAIPWRYYFKWYGSKKNQTQAVADSIAGTPRCINADGAIEWTMTKDNCDGKWEVPKACFLAQPISLNDDQLKSITTNYPNYKENDEVELKKMVQQGDVGVGDVYLIIPFEGCGGDGKDGIPDVANTCFGSITDGKTLTNILTKKNNNEDFEKLKNNEKCKGLYTLWDNGNWDWNETVHTDFMKYSAPLGLENSNYNKNGSGHLNWCSGASMHFDIGMDKPLWVGGPDSESITTTNAPSNIFMRYKRHECKPPADSTINVIDVKAEPVAGQYTQCPAAYINGSDTCSNKGCGDLACMCEVGENEQRHGCCLEGGKPPDTIGSCKPMPSGPCSAEPCNGNMCRSSLGNCGGNFDAHADDAWCNSQSTWTPDCPK